MADTNIKIKQKGTSELRLDSSEAQTSKSRQRWRKKTNERTLSRIRKDALERRSDAVEEDFTGQNLARDLEHIYDRVLEQEFASLDGFDFFPLDETVPEGAEIHTQRRTKQQGEATVYDGRSKDRGSVSVSKKEESFPIRHYVVEVELDFFEDMASGFAGTNLRSRLEGSGRRALMELADDVVWEGLDEWGLEGVLDYLHMPKRYPSTSFARTANAKDMLATLELAANTPQTVSEELRSPNTLTLSGRLNRRLRQTRFDDGTGDSVMDRLLEDTTVEDVRPTSRLQDFEGDGLDGLLFYRNERMAVSNVVPTMPEMLPIERSGFDIHIPMYMSHGGILQRRALNNCLAVVNTKG